MTGQTEEEAFSAHTCSKQVGQTQYNDDSMCRFTGSF